MAKSKQANTKSERETERKAKRRESRNNGGGGTIDRSRVDIETKTKLRIGLWSGCGFAMEERKRLETAEQVSTGTRDLDAVEIQESSEEEGGQIGQIWSVRMDKGNEEGPG